jgi:hypothetical protein
MRLLRPLALLLGVVALAACDKNAVQEIAGPAPTAGIKFFNFGVNAPNVHFYANNRKLSATSSASCAAAKNPPVSATDTLCLTTGIQATTGIAYSGASAAGQYMGVDPGQYNVVARIVSTSATLNGDTISTVPVTVEAGKFYSLYESGFYNATTETVDAFVVEDNFDRTIDWTTASVRFVNAISNSSPMTLYANKVGATDLVPIGGEVPYKSAGAFVPLAPGAYDLHARYAGSTTDKVVRTAVSFQAGIAYTISARGDITVTSTTAANRPFLDNTTNR